MSVQLVKLSDAPDLGSQLMLDATAREKPEASAGFRGMLARRSLVALPMTPLEQASIAELKKLR